MSQKNIEKWDWRYALLKQYVNLCFRSYFKKLKVQGKENIPKDSPVIFAPNHQNALMDALAILYTTNDQPVFLARSDIFKKKTIARILTFLKILPIYRIRDGYGNLKHNDDIIKKIHDILAKNHYLVIFPEGNHGDKRRLRNLKKGISRIAFQTEEQHDYTLGLKIVPVGLDYSNYYRFNETLFVNFGKPIDISKFFSAYKENPSKGHLALKKKLAGELKKYMIHINTEEHYEMIDFVRNFYQDKMKEKLKLPNIKQPNKFIADKKVIDVCEKAIKKYPEDVKDMENKITEYNDTISKYHLSNNIINKKRNHLAKIFTNTLFLLFTLPIFIYGWLNNLLAYFPAVHFSKKMKDPQFISSIKYGIGMVTFPLIYLIQTILVAVFFSDPFITLGYIASLPATGYFAYFYHQIFQKSKKELQILKVKRAKPKVYKRIIELKEQIINKMDSWINQIGISE